MKIRKYFCWLFGHRYPAIWFKPTLIAGKEIGYTGVADTEAGCTFCGYAEPNSFPINADHIDWSRTKHRHAPPENNVYYPVEGEENE